MKTFFQRQSPVRLIALGFVLTILAGSVLLCLPCSVKEGVTLPYIDALYTATSAVCVTGLVAADAGDTFTALGQFFLGLLIHIGGLGVTSVGAGVIIAMGGRVNLKGRSLIREAMNLDSGKGIVHLVKDVFETTVIFEGIGAALCFPVFLRDHSLPRALGISVFHSVAAFNNAGFDILGNMQSLIPYRDDVLLNLVTCVLIFFGGIGFLVIREMRTKRLQWKRYSMHAKVVLSMSLFLIVAGTLLFWLTEDMTWLEALFQSVSARTAGFSTYSIGELSNAGLIVMILLMCIGASPGSTGGGIKTSTLLVLVQGIRSAATNESEKAFRYAIPRDAFRKAAVIALLALTVVTTGTYLLSVLEPQLALRDVLFEVASAYGTAGLSTGISPGLGVGAKLVSIVIMYIRRLGPLTVVSLWHFSRGERVRFPEGNIAIG